MPKKFRDVYCKIHPTFMLGLSTSGQRQMMSLSNNHQLIYLRWWAFCVLSRSDSWLLSKSTIKTLAQNLKTQPYTVLRVAEALLCVDLARTLPGVQADLARSPATMLRELRDTHATPIVFHILHVRDIHSGYGWKKCAYGSCSEPEQEPNETQNGHQLQLQKQLPPPPSSKAQEDDIKSGGGGESFRTFSKEIGHLVSESKPLKSRGITSEMINANLKFQSDADMLKILAALIDACSDESVNSPLHVAALRADCGSFSPATLKSVKRIFKKAETELEILYYTCEECDLAASFIRNLQNQSNTAKCMRCDSKVVGVARDERNANHG